MNIHAELALAALLQQKPYADMLKTRQFAEVAAILNAPRTVPNPDAGTVTRSPVVQRIRLEDVMGAVSSASRNRIRALVGFIDELRAALSEQNMAVLAVLLEDALTAQAITLEEAAALQPLLDPANRTTYVETTAPATLPAPSIAQELGVGNVQPDDVQELAHRYLGV